MEDEGIVIAVKEIVEQYGIEILHNTDRTNALLMDYVPHLEKERKLLVMIMREGVFSRLKRLITENEETQIFEMNKCVKQLIADTWITEAAAKHAVLVLSQALGMQINLEGINLHVQDHSAQAEEILDGQIQKVFSKDMELSSEDAITYAMKDCAMAGYKSLAANTEIREIQLPESVQVIYPRAFLNCINLHSISIAGKVKSIGRCAFEGCASLERIQIPDGLKFKVIEGILIDKSEKKTLRAENHAEQDLIRIVNGVTTICKKTFDYSKVKQICIPSSVHYIEEKAFF